ncbi:MAG TPA: hypothetical protein VHE35_24830, partial [Kofleriaceae bacterium]|nr:hypothetical protein [Kofleriaceae bacterium]
MRPKGWFAVAGCVAFVAGCGGVERPDRCHDVLESRDWKGVAASCVAGFPRAEIGLAWPQASRMDAAETKWLIDRMSGTPAAFDALCVSGYGWAARLDDSDGKRSRALLRKAIFGYLAFGRPTSASYALGYLSRSLAAAHDLRGALWAARRSVDAAHRSGDARAKGVADTMVANLLVTIGEGEDARDHFMSATDVLDPWPEQRAFAYLEEGLLLVALGTEADLRNAIGYFDSALRDGERAIREGRAPMDSLLFAAHIDRADAHAQLGELDAARADLDVVPGGPSQARSLALVSAEVAARAGDLDEAEQQFRAAQGPDTDLDLQVRVAVAIAALRRERSELDGADALYRDAIGAVERLREAAGIELRPWVLAARDRPYLGLLDLLVERGRGVEALAMAESLHGRAWLDAVAGTDDPPGRTDDDALMRARARERGVEVLGGGDLLDRVGDREALVLVAHGDAVWRLHVRQRKVAAARLSPDEVAAVAAFRAAPADPAAATAAGAALVPADVAASAEP